MSTNDLLLAYTLEKDEKIELRVPSQLKAILRREARSKGFKTLSKYLYTLILGRGRL